MGLGLYRVSARVDACPAPWTFTGGQSRAGGRPRWARGATSRNTIRASDQRAAVESGSAGGART
jgi:hypothetical protein